MQHEVHNRVLERLARFYKKLQHIRRSPLHRFRTQQMRLKLFPVLFDLAHDQPRIGFILFLAPRSGLSLGAQKLQLRFADVAMFLRNLFRRWLLAVAQHQHGHAVIGERLKPSGLQAFHFAFRIEIGNPNIPLVSENHPRLRGTGPRPLGRTISLDNFLRSQWHHPLIRFGIQTAHNRSSGRQTARRP